MNEETILIAGDALAILALLILAESMVLPDCDCERCIAARAEATPSDASDTLTADAYSGIQAADSAL